MNLIWRKIKIGLLTILGLPLLLITPFVLRYHKKLENQFHTDPDSMDDEFREYMQFTKMDEKTYEELLKGNYKEAKNLSLKLLELAENYTNDWNYGNAVHHANTVLGLLSVKEGNIEKAIHHLKMSGDISGSPQLNSHGPCLSLAMELLLISRDSDVIDYLQSVDYFWDCGYKKIPKWIATIESGEVPEEWERLKY